MPSRLFRVSSTLSARVPRKRWSGRMQGGVSQRWSTQSPPGMGPRHSVHDRRCASHTCPAIRIPPYPSAVWRVPDQIQHPAGLSMRMDAANRCRMLSAFCASAGSTAGSTRRGRPGADRRRRPASASGQSLIRATQRRDRRASMRPSIPLITMDPLRGESRQEMEARDGQPPRASHSEEDEQRAACHANPLCRARV
jgi:hypothetical protein